MIKKTTCGILAHVDGGKTTLSEAMLFNAGVLKALGRVDHGDTFLDTDSMEKKRGITIYSKGASFLYKDTFINLVDTPGHVDFSVEAERALWVLDKAVLIVSAVDGVTGHTKTLFNLLRKNKVPTIIFINKVDQLGADVDAAIYAIKKELSNLATLYEDFEGAACNDEGALEEYLENDTLSNDTILRLFETEKWFPIFTGSALKNMGVIELLDFIGKTAEETTTDTELGIRVYKIESLGRDFRLSFGKVTGGKVAVKDILPNGEKVDQIRRYSGAKYEQINVAQSGDIVAFVGPKTTYAGQGLGTETDNVQLATIPVLEYGLKFNDDTNPKQAYPEIFRLNEEEPSLHVVWDEKLTQIKMRLMGEVQAEIIVSRIKDFLNYDVDFVDGKILYKETIEDKVEGVGHFEPLRHYAEVHLMLEPAEPGSGVIVDTDCSTDDLALNWQRLIETHVLEKEHLGVLTGSPLTDVKITVIGGRAHIKHTEGGDFREATYRAIRQGLMCAKSVLLEPYYSFEIVVEPEYVGRAMNDIEKMKGSFEGPFDENGFSKITGRAPAILIRNYQATVNTFTKGKGTVTLSFLGYFKCHNEEEIIGEADYNPEGDLLNSPDSVFCSGGVAVLIPWYEVKSKCHVPCLEEKKSTSFTDFPINGKRQNHGVDEWLDPDEIDKILYSATHNNVGKNTKKTWNYGRTLRSTRVDSDYVYHPLKETKKLDKYLLVDGYNLIYAWPELKAILDVNLDGARGKLLDILSNYQSMTDYIVIAVFDAYRVRGHKVEILDYQNIHEVFTAEAQTADAYIEKFSHSNSKKYDITVVTSDGLEQVIIRGAGARLISSREFIKEVELKAMELREKFGIKQDE